MKNEERNSETWRNANRWPLIVSIVLFLAVLTVCALYHQTAITPMESFEIGPASDPARWIFSLEDGTVIHPEDGALPVSGPNAMVICETELTEPVEKPLLVVNANSSDCVFILDGKLVYSASGRYADGTFDSSDYQKATASGQFRMSLTDSAPRLTMIVQFQGDENRLSKMPKLTLYPEVIHYLSQYTGATAGDALPAGIYFTVALFLMGLFLFGLWKQKSDLGLILLAFCSLAMAFQRTASYGYGVMELFQSPTVTWFCTVLPQAAMSWTLWYRLSKKLRLLSLPIPGLSTAAMLALFAVGLNNLDWVKQMQLMTSWVLPAAVLIMLIIAAIDAAKENAFLRRFFRYFALSIPAVALGWAVSLLTDGELAQTLKTAFTSIFGVNPSLYFLGGPLCTLLLILCFIQAVLELISGMARQDAEMQAMALRESYAMENLEIMRQSQEETRRQRHEITHHLTLLEGMLSQKQDERAADYIQSLLTEAAALPSDSYSDNMVVNAIAGYYLNLAKAEGVQVETDIRTKTELPLKDEELCILLTNLLENALEACRAMPPAQDRFISLGIFSDGEHLHITCENSADVHAVVSTDGTIHTSKSDTKSHGYGLPAMRRIVEKHYGAMNTVCADGRFTVKITL